MVRPGAARWAADHADGTRDRTLRFRAGDARRAAHGRAAAAGRTGAADRQGQDGPSRTQGPAGRGVPVERRGRRLRVRRRCASAGRRSRFRARPMPCRIRHRSQCRRGREAGERAASTTFWVWRRAALSPQRRRRVGRGSGSSCLLCRARNPPAFCACARRPIFPTGSATWSTRAGRASSIPT